MPSVKLVQDSGEGSSKGLKQHSIDLFSQVRIIIIALFYENEFTTVEQ